MLGEDEGEGGLEFGLGLVEICGCVGVIDWSTWRVLKEGYEEDQVVEVAKIGIGKTVIAEVELKLNLKLNLNFDLGEFGL